MEVMEIDWFNPGYKIPTVSIANYGIVFNSTSVEKLKKSEYIKIGYDYKANNLIVKPCKEEDKDAVRFYSRISEYNTVKISLKSLIRFLKSRVSERVEIKDQAKSYPAVYEEGREALIVDLDC